MNYLLKLTSYIKGYFRKENIEKTWLTSIVLLTTYLFVIQKSFILSGDVWAEAFPEYLNEAHGFGWKHVFMPSLLGYLTLIPSFLSKLYVSLKLPIGYIDYYYRIFVSVFAVICSSLISHSDFRKIIKNDYLRLLLSLTTLSFLSHISVFSFINVWYMGFLVIIIVSLAELRLSKIKEVFYVIFSIICCLSKPSVFILPFIFYHAVKTGKYIGNILITVAVILQAYFLFFSANGVKAENFTLNVRTLIPDLILGTATLFMKALQINPNSVFTLIIISYILIVLAIYLIKKRGVFFVTTILLGLVITVYSYLGAPDSANLLNLFSKYDKLYSNIHKLQREILVYFLLVLPVFIYFDNILSYIRKKNERYFVVALTLFIIAVLSTGSIFRTIDTESAELESDISAFRYNLNNDSPICLPLPPNPIWGKGSYWFYQRYIRCGILNRDREPDLSTFNLHIGKRGYPLPLYKETMGQIYALSLLVRNEDYKKPAILVLTDSFSGKVFKSTIRGKKNDDFSYVIFNLHEVPLQESYNLTISLQSGDHLSQRVYLGEFINSEDIVFYLYYEILRARPQ